MDKLEEIGYIKIKSNDICDIYEKNLRGYAVRAQIYFDKTHNTVCGTEIDEDYEWSEPLQLSVKELEAIKNKLEEQENVEK